MVKINYSFHYSNWHSEDTREADINHYNHLLDRHYAYPEGPKAKVLDLGCGTGNLLLALQRRGYVGLSGVDLDETQVSLCRSHQLNVCQANAIEHLSGLPDGSVDLIFALDIVEHMDKPSQLSLLIEAHRVLNQDGKIMISVPNALSPLGHYFEHIDWTHFSSFSPISLAFLLRNAGFHNFALRPTHQESDKIRELKKPWVDLLDAEFGIRDPILTPSIVAICFKDPLAFKRYQDAAPDLLVFKSREESKLDVMLSKLKAFFNKL